MVLCCPFSCCYRSKSKRTDSNKSGTCESQLLRHLYKRKVRRLFIPKKLKDEAQAWLAASNKDSGYLFLNRFGERITPRGIAQQLKRFAIKYGLNPKVVYPHSFRHRYAKNFLERFNEISLLADLMGHECIETTRIYLRRTASEQQAIVDKIIT